MQYNLQHYIQSSQNDIHKRLPSDWNPLYPIVDKLHPRRISSLSLVFLMNAASVTTFSSILPESSNRVRWANGSIAVDGICRKLLSAKSNVCSWGVPTNMSADNVWRLFDARSSTLKFEQQPPLLFVPKVFGSIFSMLFLLSISCWKWNKWRN